VAGYDDPWGLLFFGEPAALFFVQQGEKAGVFVCFYFIVFLYTGAGAEGSAGKVVFGIGFFE
jgi:hypothetical protein